MTLLWGIQGIEPVTLRGMTTLPLDRVRFSATARAKITPAWARAHWVSIPWRNSNAGLGAGALGINTIEETIILQ